MYKKLKDKVVSLKNKVVEVIESKKAETYVDTGVKVLIAVVIGALLLALLYSLFDETIAPAVVTKVGEIFNYAG
ncbi:MAG: DUF6133 family protein [Clostridia bacterium]|nr:DUF6133 family protein [Clostridia bacterium]